jgi:hypothetical protein
MIDWVVYSGIVLTALIGFVFSVRHVERNPKPPVIGIPLKLPPERKA